MVTTNFRHTGLTVAKVANRASGDGAGVIVAAPGSGKQVVVFDVLTSAVINLTDGSAEVIHLPAVGGYHFVAGVPFGDNKAVTQSGASNMTVTYQIVESS